jgi:hypothetical protein
VASASPALLNEHACKEGRDNQRRASADKDVGRA